MICFSRVFRRTKAKETSPFPHDEAIPGSPKLRIFSYKELKDATNDFSSANRIGKGGFATVYQGRLRSGAVVAVKVLSVESRHGVQGFLSELTTISNVVHKNLIQLLGCCTEGNHKILIYEYLTNNNLARALLDGQRSKSHFDWKTRARICLGVAEGLAFLHEEVHPHIVHRDIKASNVLLDDNLNPRLSDFGLAKLLPQNMSHISTRVAGTMGYLAPEYAFSGRLTRKADVYSFGILLLEIISGRSNTDAIASCQHQEADVLQGILVLQAWALYNQNDLCSLIDPALDTDLDLEEACRFLEVGLLCTQDKPKLRPSMSVVVKMLTGVEEVKGKFISKPGLISNLMDLKVKSQRREEKTQSPNTTPSSLNSQMSLSSTAFSE